MRLLAIAVITLGGVVGVLPQSRPAAYAVTGANLVLDNDRVVVWNVNWDTAQRTPMHEHRLGALEITVSDAALRVELPDGRTVETTASRPGAVAFIRPGVVHAEQAVGRGGRTVAIEIKLPTPQPPPVVSNLPRAFPRQDATKLLEDDRMIVWDVRWVPERPVPAHTHDRDVVSVTIEPGDLKFTAADGQVRLAPQQVGAVVYVPRGNSHREESVASSPRAIIVELK